MADIGVHDAERLKELQALPLNWNPKKIWVPSQKGLGMKYVFETVNEIYGKDFYRYD